jgi:hypothetical protein
MAYNRIEMGYFIVFILHILKVDCLTGKYAGCAIWQNLLVHYSAKGIDVFQLRESDS